MIPLGTSSKVGSWSKIQGFRIQLNVFQLTTTHYPPLFRFCCCFRLCCPAYEIFNSPKRDPRLFRVPWTTRRSNQSILKEINTEYSLEGQMLKLKLQYFGHVMWTADLLEKDRGWERLKAEGKESKKDEMVGWHHWCNGHELEQTLGDGEGQGGLVCCSPWGHKDSDTNGWLNKNNNIYMWKS